MSEPYKFHGHNAQDLLERGKSSYGSKKSNTCECPTCFGGGRIGLFNCENCKGTGKVVNSDGTEILEEQEKIQKEGEVKKKDVKKIGPYFENK